MHKRIAVLCAAVLAAGGGFAQEPESPAGEESSSEILLPAVTTYIDSPVVEQRQILTAEEIGRLNTESLTALLQSAGIQTLSYGAYGLESKPSIRGFTDETVRVVVDGICMNNAQYGTFDFSTINVSDIERLEIVRGGFTEGVSDEGAVGGVIYITTKKQQLGRHFSSDSSIKTFFNPQQPLDTFSQKFGYSRQIGENSFVKEAINGTFAANKYLYEDYKKQKASREHSDVFDLQNDAQLSHFFGGGNSISVRDLFYYGHKHTPGSETSGNHGTQLDADNSVLVSLNQPAVGNRLSLQNNLAWNFCDRDFSDNNGASHHNLNTLSYSCIARLFPLENIRQSGGLTMEFTHLDSTDDGLHNQFSGTLKETTKISLGRIFSLSVPLAVKFCGTNLAFTPKLGVRADFPHVDFLLDGYRMVQFPNMDDLYWDDGIYHGNPDLKPEDGWGADFTVNVHDVPLPFSLCVFTNYYENKIQWSGTSPQNVASAFYLGCDIAAQKTFFQNRLSLRANAEYLYTALLDRSNKYTYGKRIMWTPDWTAGFFASLTLENLTLTADASFVGKRYLSNMNISYLESYFLLNANAELTAIPHLSPYLRIDNLLNTSYQAVDGYPMPGISATLGIKITF